MLDSSFSIATTTSSREREAIRTCVGCSSRKLESRASGLKKGALTLARKYALAYSRLVRPEMLRASRLSNPGWFRDRLVVLPGRLGRPTPIQPPSIATVSCHTSGSVPNALTVIAPQSRDRPHQDARHRLSTAAAVAPIAPSTY
jgi:hypothetical protein